MKRWIVWILVLIAIKGCASLVGPFVGYDRFGRNDSYITAPFETWTTKEQAVWCASYPDDYRCNTIPDRTYERPRPPLPSIEDLCQSGYLVCPSN